MMTASSTVASALSRITGKGCFDGLFIGEKFHCPSYRRTGKKRQAPDTGAGEPEQEHNVECIPDVSSGKINVPATSCLLLLMNILYYAPDLIGMHRRDARSRRAGPHPRRRRGQEKLELIVSSGYYIIFPVSLRIRADDNRFSGFFK
jgi:hypothetical protein